MSSTAAHQRSVQSEGPAVRRLWAFIRREPLVHFVALAALLFLANAFFSGPQRERIVVDRATQDFLIRQQQDLLLRELSEAEKQEVIDSFVEEEILVREAYKQGLDKSGRIRALLLQNMRFFLSRDLPNPTEGELRAYFEENRDRFTSPAALTLDHVFFRDPDLVPDGALAHLRDGGDPSALRDDTPGVQRRIDRASQRRLVEGLGPDGARAVLAINDDRWHGPILSPQGAHFVRVVKRHRAQLGSYEKVASFLEGEWLMAQQQERMRKRVQNFAQDYEVTIEAGPNDSD